MSAPRFEPAPLDELAAHDQARRRRMINLVAIVVAGALLLGMAAAVAITGVTGPSHRDRTIASYRVDKATATAVLPTLGDVRDMLDLVSAESSYVGERTELDGVIASTVEPSSCLPVIAMGPSPAFVVEMNGWATHDSKLVAIGVRAFGFANRASAAAGFDQLHRSLASCHQVSYRVTNNPAEITARYTVTSSQARGGIPCVQWRAEPAFHTSGVSVKRTEVARMYLLGDAVFLVSYATDSGATTPAWAASLVSGVEARLQALVAAR